MKYLKQLTYKSFIKQKRYKIKYKTKVTTFYELNIKVSMITKVKAIKNILRFSHVFHF